MSTDSPTLHNSFTKLRSFAARREQPAEYCEMCSALLAPEHQHLIEPNSRRLVCSCGACSLLFPNQPELKFRRIPRDARSLPDFQMTDAQWNDLLIPINMAFFFYSSPEERVVAMYPSPAGATESLLELDAWNDVARDNPVLEKMELDVEALLVNRLGPTHGRSSDQYYLAPIDKCYKLVGLIRTNWRGLSGGTEVWREINSFFDALAGR